MKPTQLTCLERRGWCAEPRFSGARAIASLFEFATGSITQAHNSLTSLRSEKNGKRP